MDKKHEDELFDFAADCFNALDHQFKVELVAMAQKLNRLHDPETSALIATLVIMFSHNADIIGVQQDKGGDCSVN